MSFGEAIKKDFKYIRVTHPLITRMDYMRMGMGKRADGYTTLKHILGYLCMYKEDEMKDIISNGEWSVS